MKSKIIQSIENKQIKKLKKLSMPKYREDWQEFKVENAVIIRDALEAGYDFSELYMTREFVIKNSDLINYLAQKSKLEFYYQIDTKLNKSFSDLETAPGICAIYKIGRPINKTASNFIYLNGINDPGNMGTIFRSAIAFGQYNIILDTKCVDIYNYKTIQAAKDSIFKLNLLIDSDGSLLRKLKKQSTIVAATSGGSSNLSKIPKEKYCIILGNESHGIDENLLDLVDDYITIPTSKNIESLNVAIAASIIFFELFRTSR